MERLRRINAWRDSLSAAVRRRIIAGAARTSGPDVDGDRNAEALADLTGFRR